MTTNEVIYTRLTASTESQQPEPLASPPQHCADWISYAVAVVQQATPATSDFLSDSDF